MAGLIIGDDQGHPRQLRRLLPLFIHRRAKRPAPAKFNLTGAIRRSITFAKARR